MPKTELSLAEKLSKIQVEFKSNKSRFNSFGKYEKQPGILMRFDEVPQAWIFFDKSDAITVKE